MTQNQIPNNAIPVLHVLACSCGPASFAEIKKRAGLSQATVNRILKNFCEYGYAIKVGHGQYAAGPELVHMGQEIVQNQIVPVFKRVLNELRNRTHLNAELYMIASGGPVFLTHAAARGEASVQFRYGHVIGNRDAHPAALFYLAIHKAKQPEGYRDNFIIDRGGQWPELFRAAAMIRNSRYCLALSGLLTNVGEERHAELKEALHEACKEIELP